MTNVSVMTTGYKPDSILKGLRMEKHLYYLKYIILPQLCGDLAADVQNLLEANHQMNTFQHVSTVAEICVRIGAQYGLDCDKCKQSGLLHDISVIITPMDMLAYAQKQHMQIDEAENRYPFLLHQRLSAVLAGDILAVTDADVLSAIECHTTLKAHPTKLEMALFVADKLSWDQNGSPPFYEAVMQGLCISLEQASYAYIDYMMKNDCVLFPHQWLLDAKAYLESML